MTLSRPWPTSAPGIFRDGDQDGDGGLPAWWGADKPDFVPRLDVVPNATISPSDIDAWPRRVRSSVLGPGGEEIEATVFRRIDRVSEVFGPLGEEEVTVLPGTSVYLGWLFSHFGHFLTESLARAWVLPYVETADHLVFHTNLRSLDELPTHVRATFDALGIPLDRLVLARSWHRAEILVCPEAAMRCDDSSSRYFGATLARIAEHMPEPATRHDRLFLSRGDLPGNTRPMNEDECWEEFRRFDYTRITPGALGFEATVAAVAHATTVAGPVGSAMHNAGFMAPGARAVVLAPSHFMLRNDRLLANARDYRLEYLMTRTDLPPNTNAGWTLDVKNVRRMLDALHG